ncbi:MAG: lytic transglycosylase domain-containing protein, partial [Bdellovibrio sp.]|nr:lytic transglycosylase domain-containing protein [Bdellovibrio sp.]
MILLSFKYALGTPVDQTVTPAIEDDPSFLIGPSVDSFKVDSRLEKNVDFWVQIYSKYTTRQGLVHDAKYIDRVYEVIDLGAGDTSFKATRRAKKKWRNVLLSLHHLDVKGRLEDPKDLEKLDEDQKKVFNLFKDIHESRKFLNASHRKRLRFQLGQRDRFLSGLQESGKYLPAMEEIFKKEKMPIELTRLPFVESSFNFRARSKVGASGVWQFMKSTARLFIQINPAVDERNDPIRATEAAVRLLKLNYESLGNWGLAVTAYNHGRKGMMRAVRMIGTGELEEVAEEYRSRSFGFASGNFFTELLAAIEV